MCGDSPTASPLSRPPDALNTALKLASGYDSSCVGPCFSHESGVKEAAGRCVVALLQRVLYPDRLPDALNTALKLACGDDSSCVEALFQS